MSRWVREKDDVPERYRTSLVIKTEDNPDLVAAILAAPFRSATQLMIDLMNEGLAARARSAGLVRHEADVTAQSHPSASPSVYRQPPVLSNRRVADLDANAYSPKHPQLENLSKTTNSSADLSSQVSACGASASPLSETDDRDAAGQVGKKQDARPITKTGKSLLLSMVNI